MRRLRGSWGRRGIGRSVGCACRFTMRSRRKRCRRWWASCGNSSGPTAESWCRSAELQTLGGKALRLKCGQIEEFRRVLDVDSDDLTRCIEIDYDAILNLS